MSQRKTRPVIKIILIVSGLIITTIVIAALWLSQHYKAVIREQLPQVVARTGKHRYKSSLEDVSINIITRKVTLQGFHIWYDSSSTLPRPATTFNIHIPHLQVSGIDWALLVQQQDVSCALLWLDRPDIHLIQVKDTTADTTAQAVTDTPGKRRFPGSITFAAIHLQHARLLYETRDTFSKSVLVKNADIRLYDWTMDLENKKKDSTRILYASDIAMRCDSISYQSSKDKYRYTVDTIVTDTRDHTVALYGLKIKSSLSRKEFYRVTGHQKDIFSVSFGSIRLAGIDLKQVIGTKRIAADSMLLDRGAVDVYFSRIPDADPRSKLGKFPNQMLLKLPLKIQVPYTRVRNGHASYTEVNEETELPGALKFDGLNGFISNITNDSTAIRKNAHCVLDLKGKFNGGGEVHGAFDFLLSDTNGVFTLNGYLKNVHDEQITAAAKALAKTEVSSIHVQELNMKIRGDQYQAKGDIKFLYTDLALTVQKLDENGGKMKDRPFLSFLANKILLFPANPMPGDDVRTVSTDLRRDPHKSFFNLIWRNIFEGVKTTAIRNKGLAKAISKGKADRKKK